MLQALHFLLCFIAFFTAQLQQQHSSTWLPVRPDAWFHASGFTASLRGYAISAIRAGHAFYDVFTASLLLPFLRDMPVYVRQAIRYAASDCHGYGAVHACLHIRQMVLSREVRRDELRAFSLSSVRP